MNERSQPSDRPAVLGLIVNPFAGLGGAVALKGTDGAEIVAEALAAGAEPKAEARAARALQAFRRDGGGAVVTGPGALGAAIAGDAECVPIHPTGTAEDTVALVRAMQDRVGLILFAGGDGTARDVAAANIAGVPILGLPAGVKMQSSVFARTPERAGQVAAAFLRDPQRAVEPADILDIDEAARREGRLVARLYGVADTPVGPRAHQGAKAGGGSEGLAEIDAALARYAAHMTAGTLYLIGPGMTMAALKDRLGGGTLLGVDAALDGEIIARDLSEAAILALLKTVAAARIVLTVIGGQGFLLGRGNQQISPRVIAAVGQDALDILCPASKLAALNPQELAVDTGDAELDQALSGFRQIITGPGRRQVVRVAA